METLSFYPSDITPGVTLDPKKHKLKFWGESRPEDSQSFFNPIMKWLEEYEKLIVFLGQESSQILLLNVTFHMEYFNSSSAKYFFDIIKKMEFIESTKNVKLFLCWTYDKGDSDILEAGKEFQKMIKSEIAFVEAK